MHEVTCLGIIVADVIAKTVDHLPHVGKLEIVEQLELHLGGCASNAAVDLEKIGIKTAVIGRVGDDGFGAFVTGEMEKYGVDVRGILKRKESRTSASVVSVHSSGERSFLHQLGANADFCLSDVDFSVIQNSRLLFIAGSLLMPSIDGEPSAEILKRVKEFGITTVMDTAWDSTGKWMKLIAPCLPYLDYFIPSFEEAEKISGKNNPGDIADVFINAGVKTAVIKLGSKGCFIKNAAGEKYNIPAFGGINVIDTTGAGDSFAAGFIAGLIKGWDLLKCGEFANAAGAHCVMKVGATSGIKSMNETLEFIKNYNGNKNDKQS